MNFLSWVFGFGSKPERTYTPRKIKIKSPMEFMAEVSDEVGRCFSQACQVVKTKYENTATHPLAKK